jgi:hypothetical protein
MNCFPSSSCAISNEDDLTVEIEKGYNRIAEVILSLGRHLAARIKTG